MNLDSPFSMYFRFPPTFLPESEQEGWLEALKLRTAEQTKRRDFPAQIEHKNILIKWDYRPVSRHQSQMK